MMTTNTDRPKNYIHRYAELLPGGRAIMREDFVIDDELVQSYTTGSPAPMETVKKHEEFIVLAKN